MRRFWIISLMLMLLMSSAIGISAQDQQDQEGEAEALDYGNPQLLVEADWLAENLDQVVILDLRDLDEYEDGHIPGALYLDYSDLRAEVDDIPAQVADPETIATVLGDLGITADDTIILYDDTSLLHAGLVFWTLETVGHQDVRLLNGGWDAWTSGDFDMSEEAPAIEPATYEPEFQSEIVVDAEWILDYLEDDAVLLIDARSPAEYTGETVNAEYGGHIPGAYNINWTQNLEDGYFLPPDELRALYADLPLDTAETLVTYCQTGHRASVAYFTLRLMGYEDVRVYDGSWVDWGNRDDVPHVTGSERNADS